MTCKMRFSSCSSLMPSRWVFFQTSSLHSSGTLLLSIILSSLRLIYINILLSSQGSNTVDPWTAWVWTAQIHLYLGFFFIVNTTVLLDSRLVESTVMEESRIWRADYRLYSDFWLCEGSAPLTPAFFKDQVYCPFWKLSFFKPLFPIVIILFLSPFSKAFWKSSILLLSPHVPLRLKTSTSWLPFLWNTSVFWTII